MNRSALTLILTLVAGLSLSAAAEPPATPEGLLPIPDYTGDLRHRSRLTGDWGGWRTKLAEKGVQLDVDYTQYLQGIADGGIEERTDYGGHVDYLAHLDLMRMGLLPGALITFRAESRYGQSVNPIVGVVLPVNTPAFFPLLDQLDEDIAITVTDLSYTQFLAPWLGVTVGKVDTLDADLNEFASGRGKSQFMGANFLFDSTLALRMPYSTLAVAALLMPAKWLTINASVLNTKDSSTASGFSDFDDGQTASAEADFQYRLLGRPGGTNVGGLYSFDQDFHEIGGQLIFQPGQGLSVSNQETTWAVYASTWQYLWVEEENDAPIDLRNGIPDREGLGVFARAGFADRDTNPVEWSASGGLGGRGVVPTRDDDVFGLGYYYSRFQETRVSGVIDANEYAQGFEAFYDAALTPAAHLAFDVQVQRPVLDRIDTSVILGARLNLSF